MFENLALVEKLNKAADFCFREVDDLSWLKLKLRGEEIKHHLGSGIDLLRIGRLDLAILGSNRFFVLGNDDYLLATDAVILTLHLQTTSQVAGSRLQSHIGLNCVDQAQAVWQHSRAVLGIKKISQVLNQHFYKLGVSRYTRCGIATKQHREVCGLDVYFSRLPKTQLLSRVAFSAAGEEHKKVDVRNPHRVDADGGLDMDSFVVGLVLVRAVD